MAAEAFPFVPPLQRRDQRFPCSTQKDSTTDSGSWRSFRLGRCVKCRVSSDTVALRCHTHCPVSYQNKSLGSAAETSVQSWSWQNATASSIEFPSRNPRQQMDAPRALAAFPDPRVKTAVHPHLPTRWNATNRRCFPIVRCPKRVLAKSAQLESLPLMNLARHCRVLTVLSESFVTWFCTRDDVGQRLALHARRDCNSLSQQDAQSVSRFHTLANFNSGQNDTGNRKASIIAIYLR
jgi:hypothetical protein